MHKLEFIIFSVYIYYIYTLYVLYIQQEFRLQIKMFENLIAGSVSFFYTLLSYLTIYLLSFLSSEVILFLWIDICFLNILFYWDFSKVTQLIIVCIFKNYFYNCKMILIYLEMTYKIKEWIQMLVGHFLFLRTLRIRYNKMLHWIIAYPDQDTYSCFPK